MSRKKNIDRRTFLRNLGVGFGAAYLAAHGGGDFIRLAKAEGIRRRRHLINIVIWGGWDSSWYHNPIAVSDLQDLSQYLDSVVISNSQIGFEGANFGKAFKMTYRHSDSEGSMHPFSANRQFMGMGMASVFSQNDLSRIAIWKGLRQEGQHGIGNLAMQMGANSSYAVSYTGLVADSIAANDYVRPLHYMALANAPGDLFLNSAMNSGFQVPICVPDPTQMSRLTQADPNDIQDAGRRAAILSSIEKLSGVAYSGAFRRKSSRGIAEAYSRSFSSALTITGSNLSTDPEYLYCVKRVWMTMTSVSAALFGRADLRTRQSAVGVDFYSELNNLASSVSPLPSLSNYRLLKRQVATNPSDSTLAGQLAAERTTLVASLQNIPSSNLSNSILGLATNFGQAAFLVREDHSAVVDLSAWAGGDPHSAYLNGLLQMTWSMAGYREIMRLLSEKATGGGASLLDSTLLVMHTELDREQWHQPGDPFGRVVHAGTNHADSTSLLMAGMGVRGGQIIGAIHRGPKDFASYAGNAGYGYLQPLPIDFSNGMPKPLAEGGRYCSTKAIFPTILKIFGTPIPLQQITDYGAVNAIIA
ncbi:MAG: DUF1501 domain-containing protein [Cryobacterium sp.]|nr:DUF1501 domain-containing protein [Oligoflexia bacterium]